MGYETINEIRYYVNILTNIAFDVSSRSMITLMFVSSNKEKHSHKIQIKVLYYDIESLGENEKNGYAGCKELYF